MELFQLKKIFARLEAFIFDMDGVVVDTEIYHEVSERLTCHHFGIKAPIREWEGFQGRTAIDIARQLIRKYATSKDVTPEQFLEEKRRRYLELVSGNIREIDGAVNFINYAKKRFRLLALTTSSLKKEQEVVCSSLGLSCFDVIVTGEQVVNGKPHPEPYTLTVERLGLTPYRCVVLEDSDNGVLSAKRAWCWAVGITTSHTKETLLSKGADVVVSGFSELKELCDKI